MVVPPVQYETDQRVLANQRQSRASLAKKRESSSPATQLKLKQRLFNLAKIQPYFRRKLRTNGAGHRWKRMVDTGSHSALDATN